MDNEEMFSTRDIYLTSCLVAMGFAVLDTELEQVGVNSRMIAFWKFKDTPMLKETKRRYNASELLVEPKLLFTTMQALKAEVIGMSREATIKR